MSRANELVVAALVVFAVAFLGTAHGTVLTLEQQPMETYAIVTSFFRDLVAGIFYLAVFTLGSVVLLPGLFFLYLASITLGTMISSVTQIPTLRLLLYISYYLLMTIACIVGVREALLLFRKGRIDLERILSIYATLYLIYIGFLIVEYYASYFLALF
ncbi:MAG TPA: hypothetical protein EYP08_00010 [Pyrodictiaceae archaeon]|nr:hypothetical protein [Pyrodictiaceae archaeon]HIQ10844.1 hypothetical protein [Pyrodictium sp.]HIQ55215.1 hypothetical protein [Pyrodictium sp.]